MTTDNSLTSSAPGMACVSLPPRLDLTNVCDLAGDILDHDGQPLRLDAGMVEHLGGLGLQLLLTSATHWRERGLALHIAPRSAAFDAAMASFGLPNITFDDGELA